MTESTNNDDWMTPSDILDRVRRVFDIVCDPASSDAANARVNAQVYYTKDDSGLDPAKPWGRTVWMNPPYSRGLFARFVYAFLERRWYGEIEEGIVLTNACTSTKAGSALLSTCSAACFPKQRIKFLRPDGTPGGSPRYENVIYYFGPYVGSFATQFGSMGPILTVATRPV